MLSPGKGQVTHALLTRPPLTYISLGFNISPFDLHVLSTPPAFILSQDRTLEFEKFLGKIFHFRKSNAFSKDSFSPFSSLSVLADISGCFPSSCFHRIPFRIFTVLGSVLSNFLWKFSETFCLSGSFLPAGPSGPLFRNFSGLHCCLFVKVHDFPELFCPVRPCCAPVSRNSDILSPCFSHVNSFFYFFRLFFDLFFRRIFHVLNYLKSVWHSISYCRKTNLLLSQRMLYYHLIFLLSTFIFSQKGRAKKVLHKFIKNPYKN